MSLERPTANSSITSRKPTTLAPSITRNGTGRPRNFSTRLQKMCPPSRGRKGNRFTTARDRLMIAISVSASRVPKLTACWVMANEPTMPWSFLRSSALKIWAIRETVPVVTVHIASTERSAAWGTVGRSDTGPVETKPPEPRALESEADPHALDLRVVVRVNVERLPLTVADDDEVHRLPGDAALRLLAGTAVGVDVIGDGRGVGLGVGARRLDAVDRDDPVAGLKNPRRRGALLNACDRERR